VEGTAVVRFVRSLSHPRARLVSKRWSSDGAWERIRLDASDELVSDARLGRRVRDLLRTADAALAERPARPTNVVNLMGWLEASVERQRGAERP
jgi:hypothetical protein